MVLPAFLYSAANAKIRNIYKQTDDSYNHVMNSRLYICRCKTLNISAYEKIIVCHVFVDGILPFTVLLSFR